MNCTCNTAQIVRGVDVKLNVQLVYVALIHEHAYEGPADLARPRPSPRSLICSTRLRFSRAGPGP